MLKMEFFFNTFFTHIDNFIFKKYRISEIFYRKYLYRSLMPDIFQIFQFQRLIIIVTERRSFKEKWRLFMTSILYSNMISIFCSVPYKI